MGTRKIIPTGEAMRELHDDIEARWGTDGTRMFRERFNEIFNREYGITAHDAARKAHAHVVKAMAEAGKTGKTLVLGRLV